MSSFSQIIQGLWQKYETRKSNLIIVPPFIILMMRDWDDSAAVILVQSCSDTTANKCKGPNSLNLGVEGWKQKPTLYPSHYSKVSLWCPFHTRKSNLITVPSFIILMMRDCDGLAAVILVQRSKLTQSWC
eukprot:scaffold2066_cov68-Cyclotella_meneghiniana.AAC.1